MQAKVKVMKLLLSVGLIFGMAVMGFAADDSSLVKTPKGKLSYGLGMDIGRREENRRLETRGWDRAKWRSSEAAIRPQQSQERRGTKEQPQRRSALEERGILRERYGTFSQPVKV